MDAVTFEGETIGVDALVLDALERGVWAGVRAAVLASAAAEAAGREPDPARVGELEEEFRRARRLWAAEDLTQWLHARRATVDEWRGHIRGRVLAEAADAEAAMASQDHAPAAWLALLLDGVLHASAERLLAGAAAASLLESQSDAPDERADALSRSAAADPVLPLADRGPEAIAAAAAQVARLEIALERFGEQIEEEAVRRAIAEHAADWTVLEYDELVLRSEPEAREAVMCVREDGLDFAAIGAMAGTMPDGVAAVAEEAPDFARHLLGTAPGGVVGPLPADDGFRVVLLRARRPPQPTDLATAARARAAVVEERIARRLAGRVRWHVEL